MNSPHLKNLLLSQKTFYSNELIFFTELTLPIKISSMNNFLGMINGVFNIQDKLNAENYKIFETDPSYKRYFVIFDDFKSSFITNDVQSDIDNLPDCTYRDSLERWLEIYKNAYRHFIGEIKEDDNNYREDLNEIAILYGEGVIYSTKRKIEYILDLIFNEQNSLTTTQSPQNQKGEKEIQKVTIRRFCELVHDSKLNIKLEDEDVINYCKRICNKYNLKYTDSVRQHFSINTSIKKTDKLIKKVVEQIFPLIDIHSKEKLEAFIK